MLLYVPPDYGWWEKMGQGIIITILIALGIRYLRVYKSITRVIKWVYKAVEKQK